MRVKLSSGFELKQEDDLITQGVALINEFERLVESLPSAGATGARKISSELEKIIGQIKHLLGTKKLQDEGSSILFNALINQYLHSFGNFEAGVDRLSSFIELDRIFYEKTRLFISCVFSQTSSELKLKLNPLLFQKILPQLLQIAMKLYLAHLEAIISISKTLSGTYNGLEKNLAYSIGDLIHQLSGNDKSEMMPLLDNVGKLHEEVIIKLLENKSPVHHPYDSDEQKFAVPTLLVHALCRVEESCFNESSVFSILYPKDKEEFELNIAEWKKLDNKGILLIFSPAENFWKIYRNTPLFSFTEMEKQLQRMIEITSVDSKSESRRVINKVSTSSLTPIEVKVTPTAASVTQTASQISGTDLVQSFLRDRTETPYVDEYSGSRGFEARLVPAEAFQVIDLNGSSDLRTELAKFNRDSLSSCNLSKLRELFIKEFVLLPFKQTTSLALKLFKCLDEFHMGPCSRYFREKLQEIQQVRAVVSATSSFSFFKHLGWLNQLHTKYRASVSEVSESIVMGVCDSADALCTSFYTPEMMTEIDKMLQDGSLAAGDADMLRSVKKFVSSR